MFRASTLFAEWRGEKTFRVKKSQWGGNDDDTFSAISFKLIEKSNNLQLPTAEICAGEIPQGNEF